jgi:hypothetical protein
MPRSNSNHQSRSHLSTAQNGRITSSYTGPLMPRPTAAPIPVASSSMPLQHAPLQVQSKTGLFQSIKEGFGFGIGTNLARSMFGPSEPAAPAAPPTVGTPPTPLVPPSQEKQKTVAFDLVYTQCMLEGGTDDFCKQLSETLK